MYIRRARIFNSGPLKDLALDFGVNDEGLPKPVLLVGSNGSGKTVLLSLIADAVFEAAAVHFTDILPTRSNGRAWFRYVGPRNITVGASGSVSIIEFEIDALKRYYIEKSGKISHDVARDFLPPEMHNLLTWTEAEGENIKSCNVDDSESRKTFAQGAYAFFPSSRSEIPFWLNRDAIPEPKFDLQPRIAKLLKKPLYVDSAIDDLLQWLLSLMADARAEIAPNVSGDGTQWRVVGDPNAAVMSSLCLQAANNVLRLILNDEMVYFGWLGRSSPEKIAVFRDEQLYLPSLSALSAGQSLLLGLFGTIMRYGDMGQPGARLTPEAIQGIVLVDEIDAHMHVNLQHSVIPKLMMMFPRVQFIISNHSPLLALGIDRTFGAGNFQMLELPDGTNIEAERYSEFEAALNALRSSTAFNQEVLTAVSSNEKPIVFVEGETDGPYLRRAASLLGRADLLERCDIEWIGAKDSNGQGFNTGSDALKHATSLLKANPGIMKKPVLLLHDNDSKASEIDLNNFAVRVLQLSKYEKKRKTGIENLLSDECIKDRFFVVKERIKPSGDSTTTRDLDKSALCDYLCSNGSLEDFQEFSVALDLIEDFLMRQASKLA